MALSLATPFSTAKRIAPPSASASLTVRASTHETLINRRSLSLLGGALIGLKGGDQSALAAGRRAPPPPPQEKKDPNLSAVQAKILASKKRKEAMKEEIEKLREKGKRVQQEEAPPQDASLE